jgi:hypothetical protein
MVNPSQIKEGIVLGEELLLKIAPHSMEYLETVAKAAGEKFQDELRSLSDLTSKTGAVHKLEKVVEDNLTNLDNSHSVIVTRDGGEYTPHEYYAMKLGYDPATPRHVIDSEIFAEEQEWRRAEMEDWHEDFLNPEEHRHLFEQIHEEALNEHKSFLNSNHISSGRSDVLTPTEIHRAHIDWAHDQALKIDGQMFNQDHGRSINNAVDFGAVRSATERINSDTYTHAPNTNSRDYSSMTEDELRKWLQGRFR